MYKMYKIVKKKNVIYIKGMVPSVNSKQHHLLSTLNMKDFLKAGGFFEKKIN